MPKILIQGGGTGASTKDGTGGNGSNLLEGLFAMLLSEKMGEGSTGEGAPASEEAHEIRRQILRQMNTTKPAKTA